MNQASCESICIAAMAIADGETPKIPLAEIKSHLDQCTVCRTEVEQLNGVTALLDGSRRSEMPVDVWAGLAASIGHANRADQVNQANRANRANRAERTPKASENWPWLLALGLLLAGFRIAGTVFEWKADLWFTLAPVLLAIAVFWLLRENPLRVNSELQLQTSSGGQS